MALLKIRMTIENYLKLEFRQGEIPEVPRKSSMSTKIWPLLHTSEDLSLRQSTNHKFCCGTYSSEVRDRLPAAHLNHIISFINPTDSPIYETNIITVPIL